ncbi:probable LRR receptor-like serine/threonine-protein kinase At3g47570 [Hibiscus syriacus]|uniref:probable LRR receptor-like serine/threonine-protein kinase At3g47570 n=1 Tax=Hibiscus syriacus TaxID=106335 RepID=UPI00192370FA|nr:probable LRR receptor-like serine/threonine-protein kinase At3g47570 [Hibiscus syriacus]
MTNNSISGEIPSNISSRLTRFNMRGNRLTGEIPAFLGHLSNLKFLSFANNSLRGSIPPSLGNLSSIQTLVLMANELTGILPEALGQLTNLSGFSIAGNTISGILPISMFNLSNIIIFDIGRNKIQGTFHSDLEINMPRVEFFSVQGNQISGQIPISISNASELNVLQFQDNRLHGNVPSLEKLDSLFRVNLGSNHLGHGKEGDLNFLCALANNTKLESLYVYDNNFGGVFPECINNFSSTLLHLEIDENKISGIIPNGIGNLINLEVLSASTNQLSSFIPFDVGRLQKLSGLLPNNLGSCVSLEKLFLDGNMFEGPIPPSLSSLRGLVELDLSDNNLSGGIPKFLVSFRALKYLNLSFNDFEGVIPTEGIFKNTSATFVERNNKICGGIPELHLPRCYSKRSSKTYSKIAVVIVILAVTLVSTSLLILLFRKKKEQPTIICAENSLLQLSYQSILKATDGFSMQNLLGSGSYGSVYKGSIVESGATIAIKVFNLMNQRASRSFLTECEALKNIRHRNLVKVLTAISGVDYQGNDFKALVYEFMVNGSLENWLHPSIAINEAETMRNLNFFQRVSVSIDVAHALEYLHHHCETSIIHCDLKPSNILLDEAMIGHLSDFGLAKILSADILNYSSHQSSSLGLRGTIGYTPPEYAMGCKLSTKGDVYSYGVLLLEMFTGKRPTHDMFKEGFSIHNFVAAALPDRVTEIIDPILLQERSTQGRIADVTLNHKHLQHLNSIFEVALICSAESPTARMDMDDVVSKLCSIRDKLLRPTRSRH